jgi:dihydroflavonol-4-reductase
VVYHAAGHPEQWLADPLVFDRVNTGGTRNVARAAMEEGVRRFVYTSTIDVFRAGEGESYDESVIDSEPKGTHYERSKQDADRVVVAARDEGLPAVFLHPSAVYGPGPAASPGVNDFVARLVRGEVPALLPGGMPCVFSDDVGEGHVRAEERAEPGARFILSERYATLEDIARIVCERTGRRVPRTLPLWAAKAASRATEGWAALSRKPPLVPRGQLHFMQWGARPRNDRTRRELALDFTPLETGIERLLAEVTSAG